MVQGLMAGGYPAIFKAVEGAEDSKELGVADMEKISFTEKDVLVGIAASGRTPYVLGCMEYAKKIGAATVSVTCCPGSELDRFADIGIAPAPGPEVITGSTRMKSGTAQKMVLNMLSTGAMIKLGKVYGNLMVDVKPSNEKLIRRCVSIVCSATDCDEATATAALQACEYRPKTAIVMVLMGVDAETANQLLGRSGGRIAGAVR
jgi:N-acetylmuramic acid 6-phosphate etherase